METTKLDQDIKVFYVTAVSFPEGIMDAHNRLHALVPHGDGRRYFGVSRPEGNGIVYRAAAEEMQDGEAEQLNCETLLIRKGDYIAIDIPDYTKDIQAIGAAFRTLLAHESIDHKDGYCVECYMNDKDVRCMVRLNDQ